MSWRLLIDPASSDIFSHKGEYAVAIAGLARDTDLLRTLPDALWLELYAYEFLERVRGEDRPRPLRIPFWPGAAFEAAGVVTHCWREIEAMLPEFDEVEIASASTAAVARAASRVFGELRFPVERYDACLRRWAEARGAG